MRVHVPHTHITFIAACFFFVPFFLRSVSVCSTFIFIFFHSLFLYFYLAVFWFESLLCYLKNINNAFILCVLCVSTAGLLCLSANNNNKVSNGSKMYKFHTYSILLRASVCVCVPVHCVYAENPKKRAAATVTQSTHMHHRPYTCRCGSYCDCKW